jgi:hypothetical protein
MSDCCGRSTAAAAAAAAALSAVLLLERKLGAVVVRKWQLICNHEDVCAFDSLPAVGSDVRIDTTQLH